MADMSKSSVNARYDKIRQMVKDGKISAKEAAKLGRAMSKDYHSKGNAAQRKKDSTPKPPVASKPTTKPPASKPPVQGSGSTKKPPAKSTGSGVYGKPMPSNPPGMRQTRGGGSKTKPSTSTKHKGGQRARVTQKGKPITLGTVKGAVKGAAKKVDKALKLTYKKGDTKTVNGITYVHNGKRFVRYTQ